MTTSSYIFVYLRFEAVFNVGYSWLLNQIFRVFKFCVHGMKFFLIVFVIIFLNIAPCGCCISQRLSETWKSTVSEKKWFLKYCFWHFSSISIHTSKVRFWIFKMHLRLVQPEYVCRSAFPGLASNMERLIPSGGNTSRWRRALMD